MHIRSLLAFHKLNRMRDLAGKVLHSVGRLTVRCAHPGKHDSCHSITNSFCSLDAKGLMSGELVETGS